MYFFYSYIKKIVHYGLVIYTQKKKFSQYRHCVQ